MEVWITVAGLFIGGEGQTFYLAWDKVESFGMNDDRMKLTAILNSGKMVHWSTDNDEFYEEVKHTVHRDVQTKVMLNYSLKYTKLSGGCDESKD